MNNNNTAGNVLFLILIAVALFAALAYAVTSSTRSGGGNVSKEKAQANAAAIIQFGTALRSSVMRLRLSNGCSETMLDFSNMIYKRNSGTAINTGNATAPLNKKCHLFDPAGGNISPIVLNPESLDIDNPNASNSSVAKLGHGGALVYQIKEIGTDGLAGTESANDLIFVLSYLNRQTCVALNEILNVDNQGGEPPTFDSTGSAGSYTNGSFTSSSLWDNASITGKQAFCRYAPASLNYQFVQVLIER